MNTSAISPQSTSPTSRAPVAALAAPLMTQTVVAKFWIALANEPPLPPKVKAKQAAHLAESLARGTPDCRRIIETVVENKVRELL
jgi:hypothetical protein